MTSYDSWSWNDVPSAQVKLYRSQKETAQNCSCQGSNTSCCSTLTTFAWKLKSQPTLHATTCGVNLGFRSRCRLLKASNLNSSRILDWSWHERLLLLHGEMFIGHFRAFRKANRTIWTIWKYEHFSSLRAFLPIVPFTSLAFFGCGQGGQGSRSSPWNSRATPCLGYWPVGPQHGSPVAQKSLGTEFFYRCNKLYHSKILEMYRYVPSWKCWGAVNCCHIEQKPRDLYSTRDRSRPAHFR